MQVARAGKQDQSRLGKHYKQLIDRVPSESSLVDCGEWLGLSLLGEWLKSGHTPTGRDAGIFLAEALLTVRGRNGALGKLEANRVQRAYEERRGLQNVVLKARQMGMTTWIAGRMFLRTILLPGTMSVQVAHNQASAEEIFRIVKRFHANLPRELREGVLRVSHNNRRQMVFSQQDSEYRVESAADSNAGRGLTIQNLHCSEVARWPGEAAETLAGLRAALAPGGELVLESTPMGAHGCFYAAWQEALHEEQPQTGLASRGLVRHFFPWWWEEAYRGPRVEAHDQTREERALAAKDGLAPEQIGFRRQLRSQFRGMAAQEYAEDAEACFLASGDCVFDAEAMRRVLLRAVAPMEKREEGRLWVWFPARAGRRYVVGVDPAGGGAQGDYSALQVIDLESGLQCAEWRAKMPVRETAKVVARVAELYAGARIAVERNNHGSGLLAHLEGGGLEIYEQNAIPGWLTSTWTRPVMVERVGTAMLQPGGVFRSERLLQECRTFIRHRNGKVAAAAGCHDDCLMAMAVALSVRAEMLESGSKRTQ